MLLSREERNYLRAVLTFFQHLKTNLCYNPIGHPKIKAMFEEVRPLNEKECKALLLRLRDCDLGVTIDDIVELTGQDKKAIGRILVRARVEPQVIYDFDDVAPYIKLKEGLVFGDTHDLTSTTKEKPEV